MLLGIPNREPPQDHITGVHGNPHIFLIAGINRTPTPVIEHIRPGLPRPIDVERGLAIRCLDGRLHRKVFTPGRPVAPSPNAGSFQSESNLVSGTGRQVHETAAVVGLAFRRINRVVPHRQAVAPFSLPHLAKLDQCRSLGISLRRGPIEAEAVKGGDNSGGGGVRVRGCEEGGCRDGKENG